MTPTYRLFELDGADDQLTLIPLCARRALDAAGFKLSLETWQALPLCDRAALATAGSGRQVDLGLTRAIVSRVEPAPPFVPPAGDPPADALPNDVVAALGSTMPLTHAVWSALEPIERWALAQVAQRGRRQRIEQAYAEIVGHSENSVHLKADGSLRMVNVADKPISERKAVAETTIHMSTAAFERLAQGNAPKGDVLATARLAGIMAAKRTDELVPLCHQVKLNAIEVDCVLNHDFHTVSVTAQVLANDRTGVEMEALVAVSVAALTIYDMLKALDRSMTIGPTKLRAKSGGNSGEYTG